MNTIGKIDRCKNIPENLSTTKVSEHIPSGLSVPTISSFRSIAKSHDVCRDKDCMKTFCQFFRGHTMEIINFEKEKNEVINKKAAEIKWKCKNW